MSWNSFYKGFELKVSFMLTSAKMLAWSIFILSILILDKIPAESRTTFLISAWGISAALYGVKTLSEYHESKMDSLKNENDSYPNDNEQL
jgi:hypothetical protein